MNGNGSTIVTIAVRPYECEADALRRTVVKKPVLASPTAGSIAFVQADAGFGRVELGTRAAVTSRGH